jgi:hypothetical protein
MPRGDDSAAAAEQAPPGRDFAAEAAARVEDLVEVLRDKSVRPVMRIVQVAIFGLVAVFLLVTLLVLISVGLVRVFDSFVFGNRVWASDALVGGIFTLGGLFLLSRRQGSRSGARA